MRVPVATYRVQFNKDFRFTDATALIPDLQRLGISHLYASPIFAARAGSMHGYDVTDPNRLNPELGTEEEFGALVEALHSRGMGLLQDIVPNHMAASPENKWWMDVLENGSASRFAGYFGINWDAAREDLDEKIFLPILGGPYGRVLDKGEISLSYDGSNFRVSYYETSLPLAPITYRDVITPDCGDLCEHSDVRMLLEMMDRLPPRLTTDWEALRNREAEKEHIKVLIADLYAKLPAFREHVDRNIAEINGRPGERDSFERLHGILEKQAYRLAWWRVARDRINYRRFFDVTELIGIRAESDEVFQASHALILDFVRQGKFDGLRIDHIDGLNDPAGYLEKLPKDVYVVVEKILVGSERLPENWPVQGSSGYDFLGYVNAAFVSPDGLERLTGFYRDVIGFDQSLEDVEYDRKHLAMRMLFAGEIADLGASLGLLAEQDRFARDFSPRDITRALREVTACLPVYRTYTREQTISTQDAEYIAHAVEEANNRSDGTIEPPVFDFVRRILTLRFRRYLSEERKQAWARLVRRWQQVTGPVMAKGVEDSTFYVYNRLVSLNEVGGISHAVSASELHEFFQHRAEKWPAAMNSSSTHDTKRSEDVRARLNVLSEIPDDWIRHVTRWRRLMKKTRGSLIDDNEEYFIYQNLLGAWPLNAEEIPQYRERFQQYLVKAAREARVHTNWIQPSEEHESALRDFAGLLFENEAFQSSFQPLFEKIAWYGAINSLSQLLLKVTAPGVPDFYRGTIGWDFSLVDPDNRRPVEFAPLTDFSEPPRHLFTHWRDGRVKIYLTGKLLGFRQAKEALFSPSAAYIPVEVTGTRAGHVLAFVRQAENEFALVVVPRFVAQISSAVRPPLGQRVWQDTEIKLPEEFPVNWTSQITGEAHHGRGGSLSVARILSQFPVALLTGRT